jgi:hypothetical protein
MKRVAFLLIMIACTRQAAAQFNYFCQQNVFLALEGNAVKELWLTPNSVIDIGTLVPAAPFTLNSLAYGNDITGNPADRVLYSSTTSGLSPCQIVKYTGASWDTITSDTIVYHQAGAYGPFVYFQHWATSPTLPNDQCIARLTPSGGLIKIFTDTSLRFTVADLAIDSTGNIYCFRGPSVGNTSELIVIDPAGTIINTFTGNLNNLSTLYGCMFLNDTLYIGWGTTNGMLFPVQFSGSTFALGPGVPTPMGVSYKDLATCHDSIIELEIANQPPSEAINVFPNPFSSDVSFSCDGERILELMIYNADGRMLYNTQGYASKISWNGMGNEGLHVLPGIYIACIRTDKNFHVRKIVRQ